MHDNNTDRFGRLREENARLRAEVERLKLDLTALPAAIEGCEKMVEQSHELEKLRRCRDELRECTDAIGDLGVNLVCTLPDSIRAIKQRAERAESALRELVAAVTSKRAEDSNLPIAWSGSPAQNRAMYAAIDTARAALEKEAK
jgi:chromosome segregation ATPase